MKKIMFMAYAVLALSACSKEEAGKDVAKGDAEAKSRITYESPVKFSADPKVKQQQQAELVDAMIKDPGLDLETIQGEAMRRGVTLSAEQIAYKKAHPVDRNAPRPLPEEAAPDTEASSAAEPAATNS